MRDHTSRRRLLCSNAGTGWLLAAGPCSALLLLCCAPALLCCAAALLCCSVPALDFARSHTLAYACSSTPAASFSSFSSREGTAMPQPHFRQGFASMYPILRSTAHLRCVYAGGFRNCQRCLNARSAPPARGRALVAIRGGTGAAARRSSIEIGFWTAHERIAWNWILDCARILISCRAEWSSSRLPDSA